MSTLSSTGSPTLCHSRTFSARSPNQLTNELKRQSDAVFARARCIRLRCKRPPSISSLSPFHECVFFGVLMPPISGCLGGWGPMHCIVALEARLYDAIRDRLRRGLDGITSPPRACWSNNVSFYEAFLIQDALLKNRPFERTSLWWGIS